MNQISTPLTVCLIDDDRIYQFTAKRILQLVNPQQKVLIFSNGKEAFDFFSQHAQNTEHLPDVVFLDINMPVMNGWDFLDKMVKDRIDYKVIILTSSVNTFDRMMAKKYENVIGYVEKPATIASITPYLTELVAAVA